MNNKENNYFKNKVDQELIILKNKRDKLIKAYIKSDYKNIEYSNQINKINLEIDFILANIRLKNQVNYVMKRLDLFYKNE